MKIKKENVCIIPARGGSKRIPLKNIKKFQGVPIIVQVLKAINSKLFDKIIVTTDNKQIANLAKKTEHKYTQDQRNFLMITQIQ